jgi:hypothetical protein
VNTKPCGFSRRRHRGERTGRSAMDARIAEMIEPKEAHMARRLTCVFAGPQPVDGSSAQWSPNCSWSGRASSRGGSVILRAALVQMGIRECCASRLKRDVGSDTQVATMHRLSFIGSSAGCSCCNMASSCNGKATECAASTLEVLTGARSRYRRDSHCFAGAGLQWWLATTRSGGSCAYCSR